MTSNYRELNGKPTLSNMNLGQYISDASICSDNSGCPSDLSAYHDFECVVQNESIISPSNNPTCLSLSHTYSSELTLTSKCRHSCNLNIQHILPKLDELRILMANDKCADILGLCESFLDPNIMDQQVAIEGYVFICKDRMDTQNKTGGGLILYFRISIKCKRRQDYEISKLETIWAQIELPNTKLFWFVPFTVHQVYTLTG